MNWIKEALNRLQASLKPVPTELNDIDWKSDLSSKSERLAQHISAFANQEGGGFLVFGVNDDATFTPLAKARMDEIIKKWVISQLIT